MAHKTSTQNLACSQRQGQRIQFSSIQFNSKNFNHPTREKQIAARRERHGRSIILEKRNVLRFDLMESGMGFYQREKGRSFHADGPKTEKE